MKNVEKQYSLGSLRLMIQSQKNTASIGYVKEQASEKVREQRSFEKELTPYYTWL